LLYFEFCSIDVTVIVTMAVLSIKWNFSIFEQRGEKSTDFINFCYTTSRGDCCRTTLGSAKGQQFQLNRYFA